MENEMRKDFINVIVIGMIKKKLRPLCLTPQSQKINTQASVSHVEGSTEHLI